MVRHVSTAFWQDRQMLSFKIMGKKTMTISASLRSAFTAKNRLIAAGVLALALPAVGIFGASNAAFSGSTENGPNTWDASTIALTNNHASALFTTTNVSPGYTEEHCITISSTSSKSVPVKVYSESLVAGPLADAMTLTIREGSGGTNVDGVAGAPGSCSGFTADGAGANVPVYDGSFAGFGALTDYSNGGGTAVLAPAGSKQYKITATLPAGASNTLQSTSTGVTFVWEAQG